MGDWVDQVHRRAALLHEQIAAVRRLAPEANFSAEEAVKPYLQLVEELYADELPYARLLDESDLVVHAEGYATTTEEPRVSALTHLLEQLRDESRRLAKVVAGIAQSKRVDNVDLLVSGLAHGSLVIGLKVVPPAEDPRQGSLLSSKDEPVFLAIRSAIRALSELPHFITDEGVGEEVRERVTDPAIRDATLVALKRLSPSGRGGIDRISLSAPGAEPGLLTPQDRRVLRNAIAHPKLRRPARGTFIGVVRELDLDANRFEIRQVRNIGAIRCIYTDLRAEHARRWLDREVKVSGLYERDANGKPRLLTAETVTVKRVPKTRKLDLGPYTRPTRKKSDEK